jgi:dephospho-CoA kinase
MVEVDRDLRFVFEHVDEFGAVGVLRENSFYGEEFTDAARASAARKKHFGHTTGGKLFQKYVFAEALKCCRHINNFGNLTRKLELFAGSFRVFNMLWIGITGPMGSGKSTVATLLRQMGYEVLDADEVSRKVLSPGTFGETQVFQTFGQGLKNAQGVLDRRALGRLVFGHPDKLQKLEEIIHPLVRFEVKMQRQRLRDAGRTAGFYDVPLLFEKKMQNEFDHVLVVSAPRELRNTRVQSRSQLTIEEIEERNLRHLPVEFKEANASAVIRNSGSLDELRAEVVRALRKLNIASPSPAKA